ncbi:MAG: hypothetical protein V7K92_21150 [Nostoc sp.]|uniref:hypothetical protein n=1 Tax=Nostoc sp. TaxID=1180 RepID=UPI002FEF5304
MQAKGGAIATCRYGIYRLNEYKDYHLKTGNYKYKYFINKVNMVLPLILGAAALGAGLFGGKKGVDAASVHSKAKNLQREAQEVYKRSELQLNSSRQVTAETLEHLGQLKLEVWDEQLGRFVKLYEQLKNVELTGQANTGEFNAANFTRDELAQMKDIALKAHEVVLGGASAVGAGALAGIASYGGAMMFASASTGTAISTLAGAAATNATLAWFGGGSLVAGGWGMAGGMFVLGGIVAGPIFAVGGMLMAAKATENLAKARSYKAEADKVAKEMEKAISVLDAINKVAKKFDEVIMRLSIVMTAELDGLESIIIDSGTNYAKYNQLQKRQVHLLVQFAQVLKLLLETPLLTKDGALDESSTKALKQGQSFLGES